MRKVSKTVLTAFLNFEKRRIKNTSTDGLSVTLHNNKIIERIPSGGFRLSMCGWPTVTTRERLNTFLNLLGHPHTCFFQHNHAQYFRRSNGTTFAIDPSATYILEELLNAKP